MGFTVMHHSPLRFNSTQVIHGFLYFDMMRYTVLTGPRLKIRCSLNVNAVKKILKMLSSENGLHLWILLVE